MSFKLNIKEGVDYLTLDYEGFRQMMINRLKERLPEYTDYSETDMGVVLIELTAHGLDILSYYKDRQALECFLETARERRSVIMHCRNFGYTLDSATPSKFIQVFEIERGSGLLLKRGDRVKITTKAESGQSAMYFEVIGGYEPDTGVFRDYFEIPAKNGINGLEPSPNGGYLYRAVVVQGQTITKEVVGYSDGSAYQKFYTHYTPAMDYVATDGFNEDIVHVFIGESGEEWTRVDNFLLSTATSKHFVYTVNEYGEGTVEFGNNISGMIPDANAKVAVTYRIGGGAETNVGANTITEMINKPANVKRTFNPSTYLVAGSDMESIEEAKVKAPASLRTLDRAVTERDYADIGLLLDNIQSADSLYLGEKRDFEAIGKADDEDYITANVGRMKVWLFPENATAKTDTLYSSEESFIEKSGEDVVTLMSAGESSASLADDFEVISGHSGVAEFVVGSPTVHLTSDSEIYLKGMDDLNDYTVGFSVKFNSFGLEAGSVATKAGFCIFLRGGRYAVRYSSESGMELYKGDTLIASNKNYTSLQIDKLYNSTITVRDNGFGVFVENELVLQHVDSTMTDDESTGTLGFSAGGGCEVFLENIVVQSYGSTFVYMPDTLKETIKAYYEDRRMIGQKWDLEDVQIVWIAPVLKCTKDSNYTSETVIGNIKSRLIELMSLGKYDLGEDLVWSDIVRELIDEETGVVGLRSVTFVTKETVEVGGVQKTVDLIAENLPYEKGKVFALNETAIEIEMN